MGIIKVKAVSAINLSLTPQLKYSILNKLKDLLLIYDRN